MRAMARTSRRSAGVTAVLLGVIMWMVSVPLTALDEDGWPWLAGLTTTTDAGRTWSTAEVRDTDGTVYEFTGTPADAGAWLAATQQHLKSEHGITARVMIGRGLAVAAPILVAMGAALLLSLGLRRSAGLSRRPLRGLRSRPGGCTWPGLPRGSHADAASSRRRGG